MTGQCPGCGEQRRLNTANLIRSHSLPDGSACPGTHEKPGRPRPVGGACRTPAKARFATVEAAESRAHGKPAIAGLELRAYDNCPCGWVHLTSQGAPEVTR